jgi:hypothetical protein
MDHGQKLIAVARSEGASMVTKTYLLEDKRFHTVGSQDFVEICELPLGNEALSYMVMAKGDIERLSADTDTGTRSFTIRLDVLSKFSVLLGRDEEEFTFDEVAGAGIRFNPPFVQFSHSVISGHISLMVAADVPGKGGVSVSATGEPVGPPPPRAILSARGGPDTPGASLTNVRNVALPADEIVVQTIQPPLRPFTPVRSS